jgi:uncharacterized protein (TIGR00369 family)
LFRLFEDFVLNEEAILSVFMASNRKAIKAVDPGFESKVRHSFSHGGLKRLGGELLMVEPGCIEVGLPFSELVQQQHGLFHGGIVSMIADTASGFATYTVLPADEECVSAEFKVNFLYPARGTKLVARGNVIKVGRTLVIAEATVSVLTPKNEMVECALMLHTLVRVKHFRTPEETPDGKS